MTKSGKIRRLRHPSSRNRVLATAGIALLMLWFFTTLVSYRSANDASLQDKSSEETFEMLVRYAPSRFDSVMPQPRPRATDRICARCIDGLVYVHLGREKRDGDTVDAGALTAIRAPVCLPEGTDALSLQRAAAAAAAVTTTTTAAPVSAGRSGEGGVRNDDARTAIHECLTHLLRLGLLSSSSDDGDAGGRNTSVDDDALTRTPRERICTGVDVPRVLLDYAAAFPQTSLGRGGQCTGFVAELRPREAGNRVNAVVNANIAGGQRGRKNDGGEADKNTNSSGGLMTIAFPRLPSWPLSGVTPAVAAPSAAPIRSHPPQNQQERQRTGATRLHTSLPAYVGTAAVDAEDADTDLKPPLSVRLSTDGAALELEFGRDEASARPAPFTLSCPLYFLSAYVGRYGRQHRQLHAIVHGISLARRLRRTFILPSLAPVSDAPFVRYSADRLYGFNALRRDGNYCVVSYAEVRPVLAELAARQVPLTMRRYSYHGEAAPHGGEGGEAKARGQQRVDWWTVPSDATLLIPAAARSRYNLDAWMGESRPYASSAAAAAGGVKKDGGAGVIVVPPPTVVTDIRSDSVVFVESTPMFTAEDVFPIGAEAPHTRLTRMRVALRQMVKELGGAWATLHAAAGSAGNTSIVHDNAEGLVQREHQLRLAMLSGRMASLLHSGLAEETRVMGLLRPSPRVTNEINRFYTAHQEKWSWPAVTTARAAGEGATADALRPAHLRHVIGFHVRRLENACAKMIPDIGQRVFALDKHYQLEQSYPSWSANHSTGYSLVIDCQLNQYMLLDLYRQYGLWLQAQAAAASSSSWQGIPSIYIGYDAASASVPTALEERLQQLRSDKSSLLGMRVTGPAAHTPAQFVAVYDGILNSTQQARLTALVKDIRANRGRLADPSHAAWEEERLDVVDELHGPALAEMTAMAVDFFVLSNVGVFRGGMLSAVTMNVVLRRLGRGLPCHGVLPGYLETYNTAVWM